MRITEVRELTVSLVGGPANAVISFATHDVSLVAVISDVTRNGKPVAGVAFNSIGRFAQRGIMKHRLIPRLLAAASDEIVDDRGEIDPGRVLSQLMRDEKPGGHGDRAAAAAAIELACWDLKAKLADEPAHATVSRSFACATPVHDVEVYAAGGYYGPASGADALTGELEGYMRAGYSFVKIKVGAMGVDDDLRRIDRAVAAVGDPALVAVDANGRFGRDAALRFGKAITGIGLRWYEEPCDPLDYDTTATLHDVYQGPIATGENLFSWRDVENLVRYGGLRPEQDVFQMDAGLSYGLSEYAKMIDTLEAYGFDRRWAYPHGGHLINLHIVTGLGLGGCEAYPGVFAPFGGYSPDISVDNGRIRAGDRPGFGLEAKTDLMPHIEQILA
ncbi:enolase C-terminal domain-like protein [Mycobacterium sp.]|uniref:enolase C-terminal domain-like protein n=1 Tax=Mycobacterium sp. TaxID=1785 RepID=UPI002C710D40|nr:enolase C-terminal domain-like protein [Mycobacterium sp.]HKP42738.1 enolase C-terminal domain-like protein [Mycobacterium sp.]